MKNKLFSLLTFSILLAGCGAGERLYPAVDIALTEIDPAVMTNEAEMNYGYSGSTNDEPTERAEVTPKVIDMGSISGGYVNQDIQSGESHIYSFTQESSGRYYEYVTFALRNTGGTFDPYLIISADGKELTEDGNSLDEDSPGAARVPGDNGGICLSPNAPTTTFEITIKDEKGSGSGSYEFHLFASSVGSDKNCTIVIP